jgi:hypothetical protein
MVLKWCGHKKKNDSTDTSLNSTKTTTTKETEAEQNDEIVNTQV